MPIYEYRCSRCGEILEVMQKISDPPAKKCDLCGGRLKKQMSNTSFVLKGTGWYATDYGKRDNGGARGEHERVGKKAAGNKPAEKSTPDKTANQTE